MQKLFKNHLWVTKPDPKGTSYLGLTDFIKSYFLRLHSISNVEYPRTVYGLSFPHRIGDWLDHIKHKYNLQQQLHQNMGKTKLAERMQYDRFCIKQGQYFSQLNTIEFNVQLAAPITMRVVELNFDVRYWGKVYESEWLFKVEGLNRREFEGLLTQDQYAKTKKIVQYQGMLI